MKNNRNTDLFYGGFLIMFSLFFGITDVTKGFQYFEMGDLAYTFKYLVSLITDLFLTFQFIPLVIGIILCVRSFGAKE